MTINIYIAKLILENNRLGYFFSANETSLLKNIVDFLLSNKAIGNDLIFGFYVKTIVVNGKFSKKTYFSIVSDKDSHETVISEISKAKLLAILITYKDFLSIDVDNKVNSLIHKIADNEIHKIKINDQYVVIQICQ